MLTGHWINSWVLRLLAATCNRLLRLADADHGVPRTNEDVIWY